MSDDTRYRVRDKEWAAVWGEDLSLEDATRLKESVVGSRKSRTARVEPMSVPPPDWYVAQQGLAREPVPRRVLHRDVITLPETPIDDLPETPSVGAVFELADGEPQPVPSRGLVTRLPAGYELHVNGVRAMSFPASVSAGDVVQAVPMDPALAQARAKALSAVAPVVAKAPRAPYKDKTVRAPGPRKGPPPRDKTASREPVLVRLGAPPAAPPRPPRSPLDVAEETDGDLIPDGVLSDADVLDLAMGIGAGPAPEDVAHAEAERDRDGARHHRKG